MNDQELDFPVLTDVIADIAPAQALTATPAAALPLEDLQETLTQKLVAELSVQVPVLVEAALREHLPQAMGAKLQAELLNALTNALPLAAQAASAELSRLVAYEVGGLLEQRLQDEVRHAVAREIAELKTRQS